MNGNNIFVETNNKRLRCKDPTAASDLVLTDLSSLTADGGLLFADKPVQPASPNRFLTGTSPNLSPFKSYTSVSASSLVGSLNYREE